MGPQKSGPTLRCEIIVRTPLTLRPSPAAWPPHIVSHMRWMQRRGDRVKITTGKYAGHAGTIESNAYQRTVDYPEEFTNGFHVMLDTEELVTVRWEGAGESWPLFDFSRPW